MLCLMGYPLFPEERFDAIPRRSSLRTSLDFAGWAVIKARIAINSNRSACRYHPEFKNNGVAFLPWRANDHRGCADLLASKSRLGHWLRRAGAPLMISEPKTLALETPPSHPNCAACGRNWSSRP
jgi:hypothetical protein